MRICFDLDDTLCVGKPYQYAKPHYWARQVLEDLKADGHTIIIYTARGMGSSGGCIGIATANVARLTLEQLGSWGFIYDEIYFGKPAADLYIDDKSFSIIQPNEIRSHVEALITRR